MSKSLSVVNRQQKLGEWAERVSACRNSGLSVRAWCQENEVLSIDQPKAHKPVKRLEIV